MVSFERIVGNVCDETGFGKGLIVSHRRNKELVDARHLLTFLASKHLAISSVALGKHLERDHSSILHAVKTFPKRCADRPELYKMAERIELRMGVYRGPTISN